MLFQPKMYTAGEMHMLAVAQQHVVTFVPSLSTGKLPWHYCDHALYIADASHSMQSFGRVLPLTAQSEA